MNELILFGRLVARPQLKTARNGKTYCTFVLAVKRKHGKPSNQTRYGKTSSTDFIECIAWGNIAQNLRRYGVKGGLLLLEAELQTFTTKLGSGQYIKKYFCYVKEANLVNWRKPEDEVTIDEVEAASQPSAFELDIADSISGYTKDVSKRPKPLPDLTISESKLAGFDGDPDMPDIYTAGDYEIALSDDDLDDFEDDDLM